MVLLRALLLCLTLTTEVVAPEVTEDDIGGMVQYILDSSVSTPAATDDCSSGASASSEERELCTFRSLHGASPLAVLHLTHYDCVRGRSAARDGQRRDGLRAGANYH